MSATTPVLEILPKALSSVYSSGGFPKIPNNSKNDNDKYRFYTCQIGWNGMECKKIDNPDSLPNNNDLKISGISKTIGIDKCIPESLDKIILKRNYTYSFSVKIEK